MRRVAPSDSKRTETDTHEDSRILRISTPASARRRRYRGEQCTGRSAQGTAAAHELAVPPAAHMHSVMSGVPNRQRQQPLQRPRTAGVGAPAEALLLEEPEALVQRERCLVVCLALQRHLPDVLCHHRLDRPPRQVRACARERHASTAGATSAACSAASGERLCHTDATRFWRAIVRCWISGSAAAGTRTPVCAAHSRTAAAPQGTGSG